MAPKRPHTKSRLGCRTCKARRVKCDEVHPVCTNCARREIDCIWSSSCSQSDSSPPSTSYVLPSPELPLSLIPCTPVHLDLTSLELLHQYMSNTSETFAARVCAKEVLRNLVPKLAISSAHLMHAILGLAALHLHNLHAHSPEQSEKYYTTAAAHHQSSIASLLTLPNTDSRETLFLTNCLIAFYEFASATSIYEPSALAPFGWFTLFRILKRNFREAWGEMSEGPLSPMLILAPAKQYPSPHPEFPRYLSTLPYPSVDAPDPGELTDDPEAAHAYQDAIRVMRRAWTYFHDPETQGSAVFMWPCSVSDKYVSLLTERRPRALIILAHHCAMMMLFQPGFWWIRRQGFDDFWKIERMLDQRWRPWLEWPLTIAAERNTTLL